MKRFLLTTLCCIIISTLFAQKLDTVVNDQWNGSVWVHQTRSIYSYGSGCLVSTILTQSWQSGSSTWADTLLTTDTYNGNNQILTSTTQLWNGSSWDNKFRIRNVYNGSNLLDTSYTEAWLSSSWQTSLRTTYTYNGDNTVHQSLTQISLGGGSWLNSSQTTYISYNADKTVQQDSIQIWQLTKWVNSAKDIYTYTSGKIATLLTQTWKSGNWQNNTLVTNTYDGSNYLTNALYQNWNNGSSTWVNNTQTNYTNNSDGTPAVAVNQKWNSGASSWDNDTRDTYSWSGCSLPLTLLSYTASKNNSTVLLNWKTTNEVNTSHFTVQRSTDGINYSNVGQVTAKGNIAATNDYSYSDNISTIKTGTIYYRLQMVDKDGRSTTSKVASITITATGIEFSIKPNPAKNFIVITAGSSAGSSAIISVTDFSGHVVIQKTINTTGDQTIDISSLQRGVYIVSIKAADIVTTKKLVVE